MSTTLRHVAVFPQPDRPDLSFHLWMIYHFLARSVWIFDYQTSQHEIIVSLIPKKIPPPPRATLWLVWWGWSKYRSHDQLLDCPHDCPHNRPHECPWLITIVKSGQAGGKVLKILKFSIPAPESAQKIGKWSKIDFSWETEPQLQSKLNFEHESSCQSHAFQEIPPSLILFKKSSSASW